MNRQTNKFHCQLRHPTKKEMNMNDNIYDKLPIVGQVLVCTAIVLLVPIWFPFWVLDELKKGK